MHTVRGRWWLLLLCEERIGQQLIILHLEVEQRLYKHDCRPGATCTTAAADATTTALAISTALVIAAAALTIAAILATMFCSDNLLCASFDMLTQQLAYNHVALLNSRH